MCGRGDDEKTSAAGSSSERAKADGTKAVRWPPAQARHTMIIRPTKTTYIAKGATYAPPAAIAGGLWMMSVPWLLISRQSGFHVAKVERCVGGNHVRSKRLLMEVEAIEHVLGGRIALGKGFQSKVLLDES